MRLDLAESPIEEARRCLDLGARGIKLHPRAQKFSVGDERLDAVFALAVEREVPILIHGGRGLPPIGDHLAALVERYAGVRLIIAHAGIADLGGLAGHFAHVPGVFFDTSVWGIVDLVDLMRQVAPEQILFATDYPYGRLPNSLLLTLRAAKLSHFDEADLRRMLGETAQGIADGAPLPALSPAKGPEETRTRCRWHGSMPTSRWRRRCSGCVSPTWRGGLGLALNAAHEANIDGVRDADLIRSALTGRSGAVGRDRRDRGSAGVRADRPADSPARPHRGHPRRDGALEQRRAAVARSTSVASTVRFHALCGCPGSPASGSAGSSGRGMFATPAAASVNASPVRAAPTETSGNEKAWRSPVRR